jgi:carnitine-CoA ligase
MSTVMLEFDGSQTPLTELRSAAENYGDRTFLTVGETSLTYAEAFDRVWRVAGALSRLGVGPGDRVVLLAPNSVELVLAWLGVHAVGAIDAPISVEAPGAFLCYLIADLEPKAVIGTPDLLLRVRETAVTAIDLEIQIDGPTGAALSGADVSRVAFSDLLAVEAKPPRSDPPAGVTGTIMYSSGTTGPSKGVMLAQGYYSALALAHIEVNDLRGGCRVYCVQPLCHVDARSAVVDTLHLRGHVTLGERFSASRFWDEVESVDADLFFYVGTMIQLIHKQPRRPLKDASRHRAGIGSATPSAIQRDFEARFNVDLVEGYGMTELGLILAQWRGKTSPGHVGSRLPWVDVQVVDDDDNPVPEGTSGELVARPLGKHLMMQGYWRKPEATLEAWRGLWFHTGDLVRARPDGTFEYVGRTKDSIRRRGENVSAWEVEEAATRHEDVLEAAAIGVPSTLGEEDVALLVVPKPGVAIDPGSLREFMAIDLPRFAVPRFIEVVESLPKTPSERVAKSEVRQRGISAAAFDFEGPPASSGGVAQMAEAEETSA